MFRPAVVYEAVAVAKGCFALRQVVLPGLVQAVFVPEYRDQVPGGAAEQARCWGLLGGRVGGVPVLEDGPLESVDVQVAVRSHIARDEPLDGFYGYLGAAVAVWEGD